MMQVQDLDGQYDGSAKSSHDSDALPPKKPLDGSSLLAMPQKGNRFWKILVLAAAFIAIVATVISVCSLFTAYYLKTDYNKRFGEMSDSFNERIAQLSLTLEQLENICMMKGGNRSEYPISLLEEIQVNFTAVFHDIDRIDSSLQDYLSNTTTTLQQDTNEQTINFTFATESLDARLTDLADEAKRNATALSDSLATLSSDLRELELETSRNLELVNSSLHQDIQGLSTRLSDARTDLHGLVNQSSADIFLHIEREILDVRGRIDTEALVVANRVSDIRGEINSSVSEIRGYIADQDTSIRRHITTSIDEVSRDIDSKIKGVEGIIDRRVRSERQHVDNEIYRLDTKLSGALPLHKSGIPAIVIVLLSVYLTNLT